MSSNTTKPSQTITLDGPDWQIATDLLNIGRDQKWFDSIQNASKTPGSAELSERWTVFEMADIEPTAGQLLELPKTLGGGATKHHEFAVKSGCLDLRELLGWKAQGKTAYVYIPFNVREDGVHTFGIGADWWHKAWIDGKVISDTLATGNGKNPIEVTNHQSVVQLCKGDHLLVVKFINGICGAVLTVGWPFMKQLGAVQLSERWTVFELGDIEPAAGQLLELPKTLNVGGVETKDHEFAVESGRLDLRELLGWGEQRKSAYVYIPIAVQEDGLNVFGFGADGWHKAWIDGEVISDTLATGNGGTTLPTMMDHVSKVQLRKGEHLLVVEFISGRASAVLTIGGPSHFPQKAMKATVPAALEMTFPGYDGVVWYWKSFQLPPLDQKQVRLKIGAAEYFCEAWLNGSFIGSHEGGNAPAFFDASSAARTGENQLVVRLINPGQKPIDGFELRYIPHSNKVPDWKGSDNKWHNFGGIWQSVEVHILPPVHFADIFVQPHWRDGEVTAHLRLNNALPQAVNGELVLRISQDIGGPAVAAKDCIWTVASGSAEQSIRMAIPNPRSWSPDDPFLYRLSAAWKGRAGEDEVSVRFGLREFTYADGYFRLNGKRFFPRCTHQAGHYPGGICRPADPSLLQRDLLCIKQGGFNMMRALGYTPLPEQLDLADQLGVLIYQETPASWCMQKNPDGPRRWESNVVEMIRRDRNHPSVVIWGLLNESVWWDQDGVILQHAVDALPRLRHLDPGRMILLDSGRKVSILSNPPYVRPDVGEFSLPESDRWTFGPADTHFYFNWPFADDDLPLSVTARKRYRGTEAIERGVDGDKKVFYSEFGFGSAMDPIAIMRVMEEQGIGPENDDYRFFKGMADRWLSDWDRLNMQEIFSTPGHLVRASQDVQARKITDLWRYVQSNPNQVGTSCTGLIDESGNGEGIYTYWRETKPAAQAVRQAQRKLRWCVFASPPNVYHGEPIQLEILLRNEDVLPPGRYAGQVSMHGPSGRVWQRPLQIVIPAFSPEKYEMPDVVFPVLKETIQAEFPAGTYEIHVILEDKGYASASETIRVADRDELPKISMQVMELGLPEPAKGWLARQGVQVFPFTADRMNCPLVVHDLIRLPAAAEHLARALEFAGAGGTVLALEVVGANYQIGASGTANNLVGDASLPEYHRKMETLLRMLPGAGKATISWDSRHWFISTEHYVRPHPVFDGLPTRCLLAEGAYEIVYPMHTVCGLREWDEITGAFCLGALGGESGYWHSMDLATRTFGKGRLILSAYRLIGPLQTDPTAGRMLLNLLNWASKP